MSVIVTERDMVVVSRYTPYDYVKRCLDLLLALIGIVASSPLVMLCAIAIKLDSYGPVFFTQERVGKDNRVFTIYKLRTMPLDAEAYGPQWAIKNDPRVTRSGRLLRRYRLDELPQLWNIVKGEMSLIGPRPERDCFLQQFAAQLPEFRYRTVIRPGLTGWAQVNGGYDLDPADKLELDLYYIRNRSLGLDLSILLRTFMTVVAGKGAR